MQKPKYKIDDIVSFKLENKVYTGKIYIVDAFGTFEQHDEPSYDIMVDNWYGSQCLVKHVRESLLINNKKD